MAGHSAATRRSRYTDLNKAKLKIVLSFRKLRQVEAHPAQQGYDIDDFTKKYPDFLADDDNDGADEDEDGDDDVHRAIDESASTETQDVRRTRFARPTPRRSLGEKFFFF